VLVTLRYPSYDKVSVPPEIRASIEALEGRIFE
jgi:acyl-CoA thioester hydrolase